jgi:uncharacterized integral membrane protein
MKTGQGYKAPFDYLELRIEQREDRQWQVTLDDHKHNEVIIHEKGFATAADAQDGALVLAKNHISIRHNDTLIQNQHVAWRQY